MTKQIPFILLPNAISLTLQDGENHVINPSHPNYAQIINEIKAKNWDSIEGLIDIPKAIVKASAGRVTVEHGEVRYNGLPVNSYLASRILTFLDQGFDIQPWVNFMEKLYTNPDPYSITQAYEFLERAKLPICPDGDFLAYKYVRNNYFDCHSGTFDNSVGQKPSMDRATCDNNPNNHCSRGLHFCAKGYLNWYGNAHNRRVVIVKVNPRDIVSIPSDHNCEKARACLYEVVGELDLDYSFDDMESSEVLPPPRTKEVNTATKPKKSVADRPNELQERILRSNALTVREHAKSLGVCNSDIVNAAGKWFTIERENDQSLSDAEVWCTAAGQNWYTHNG